MQLVRKILNKFHKQIIFLTGVATVCLFFLAWCLSTVSYQGTTYALLHLVVTLITVICYTVCLKMYAEYAWIQKKKEHTKKSEESVVQAHRKQPDMQKQLQLLNSGIIAVFLLVLVYDIRTHGFGIKENFIYFILADVVWIVCGIWNIRILQCEFLSDVRSMFACIKKHVPLFALLAISFILAIEPGELQFRWDSALYEQACRVMNLHSLSSLGAYGHLSQAYGALYCLIYALIGHVGLSMAVLNVILYLGSIIAFYALLRHLVADRHFTVYLAGMAVYAFSPFLLGMVNYYSLDYMTLCTFVIMVYFAYTRKWVLHFATALCFVFTKEPAFVVYGTFCAGIVFADFLRDGKLSIGKKMRRLTGREQYYLMLVTGILWIAMYLLIGGWSGGVGAFEIDKAYVLDKLKVLYVLNFNWLMMVIAVIGSVILLWCRNRKNRKQQETTIKCEPILWWLPLLCCLFIFTLFSVAFKTVNHARYAAVAPAILYLFAWYVIARISVSKIRQRIACGVLTICTILMFLSSYATIDPLSLLSFTQMNIGNRTMVTTGTPTIGDSMIYNKQMLYEEKAFNQALAYAIEHEYQIVIPTYSGIMYSFDGFMLPAIQKEGYCEVTQYWNETKNRRVNYETESSKQFTVRGLSMDREGLPEMGNVEQTDTELYVYTIESMCSSNQKVCYIYSPILGLDIAEQIMEYSPRYEQKNFTYRGWKICMLVM